MAPYQARRDSLSKDALTTLEQARNDDSNKDEEDQSLVQSASDYPSTHGGESGVSSEDQTSAKKIAEQLSHEESRKVLRLRIMVIGALILSALFISSIVFKITTSGEVDEFTTQYEGAADKVIDAFGDIMNRMGSVAGLGVSYTSFGEHNLDSNGKSPWPFVTLDDFPPKARNALQLSGALMVSMSPIVQGPLFHEWNEYVVQPEKTEWINQSLTSQAHFQAHFQLESDAVESDRPVDVMHYFDEGSIFREVPGAPKYLLVWQTSPYVHEGLVNNNLLRYENASDFVHNVIDSGHAVVGAFFGAPPGAMNSSEADTALLAALRTAAGGAPAEYLGDPMSNLYIPIFESLNGPTMNKVVGVLNAMLHWKSYFRNILPDDVQPVVVVLEYQCNAQEPIPAVPSENEKRRQRQRRLKGTISEIEKPEELERLTTFTIIDVSDFEVEDTENDTGGGDVTSTANDYWNLPASTTVPSVAAVGDYWNLPAGTTAPTVAAVGDYWNLPADTSAPAVAAVGNTTTSNSYWDIPLVDNDAPTTAVPTTVGPATPALTMMPTTQSTTAPTTAAKGNDTETASFFDTAGTVDAPAFFTYLIIGSQADPVGVGDLHDPAFDSWMRQGYFTQAKLHDGTAGGISVDQRCSYYLYVYPTQSFYESFITTTPVKITMGIMAVFIFAIVLFGVYNRLVEKRQRKILQQATQSTALVASLFPKNVRDRLLQGGNLEQATNEYGMGNKSRLKGFMAGDNEDNDENAAPIADLFPHCTVFFADIAGFTAWSSAREPSQVFVLLQTVYQAFDQLAKRRRVFKVETIGDCYMAVTGLPDPQESHASIMVRFAWDCICKMKEITQKLESSLGPDTTELTMRIGLHSGPVTAGVLRGDRARFQLFGDTVNTASRMESTGERGKIQVSEATANLLRDVRRDHWVVPREDVVKAKGKGVLRTYWANPKNKRAHSWSTGSSVATGEEEEEEEEEEEIDASTGKSDVLQQAQVRLVDWIVKLMVGDIRKILAARNKNKLAGSGRLFHASSAAPAYKPPEGQTCMDEVKEVIHMPKFDAKTANQTDDYRQVEIDSDVLRELGEYATGIALMYRKNAFHNFEHACHVTMSVNKLLRRIVSPEAAADQMNDFDDSKKFAMHLHDYTYGINSDPLAMFAMTFSALIHDVDHRGISNMQLAKEVPDMATMYKNKSLAEQNSLDLAWEFLMDKKFSNLRSCLFGSQKELMRFRQLIVNIVLATDIFDQELNDLRRNRWKKAFCEDTGAVEAERNDLRATIVIEHIIQASDVSHTMQHWHVYQKWNRCLFKEMHAAYKSGRLGKDPGTFWYQGEMGFFDNYIIPLAKKLKDCGVFGVASDEYLNYAVQNRAEWEERGEEIVASMVEECAVAELGEASTNVRRAVKDLSLRSDQMIKDAKGIRQSKAGAAEPDNLKRDSMGGSSRAKGTTLEIE